MREHCTVKLKNITLIIKELNLFMQKIFFLVLTIIALQSCKINYSLSGGNLEGTLTITDFPNRAPKVNPDLSQMFTEDFKAKFISQTSLELINGFGDYNFEGEITDYSTKSLAIQANETASLNRLSISVRIKFTDSKESKNDFDQTFTRFEDYDSSVSLDDVEAELSKAIVEQIIEDVFNKSVVNW